MFVFPLSESTGLRIFEPAKMSKTRTRESFSSRSIVAIRCVEAPWILLSAKIRSPE